MSVLYKRATLRADSLLRAAIEDAARVHKGEAYGLCFVDLRGERGRRFAVAIYEAKPCGPDPAKTAPQETRIWGRSFAIDALEPIIAAMLGEDMRAAVLSAREAGSVPVLLIVGDCPILAAFAAPNKAP